MKTVSLTIPAASFYQISLPNIDNLISANSVIKKHSESTNTVATFFVSVNSTHISLSLTANSISKNVSGKYSYDVVGPNASNNIIRSYKGHVFITPAIT